MQERIEVICGPMFSGKTEELLRRIKRAEIAKQSIWSFKPAIDDRYSSNEIVSHSGQQKESTVVESTQKILEKWNDIYSLKPQVVAIEEVQFFDNDIVDLIEKLVYYNRTRVIVAGLDMDYKGKPFPVMASLLAKAEKVTKLNAVCTICGNKATKTWKRPSTNQEKIDVGGIEKYEPRCSYHWINYE